MDDPELITTREQAERDWLARKGTDREPFRAWSAEQVHSHIERLDNVIAHRERDGGETRYCKEDRLIAERALEDRAIEMERNLAREAETAARVRGD
jgi:hypothetical protein